MKGKFIAVLMYQAFLTSALNKGVWSASQSGHLTSKEEVRSLGAGLGAYLPLPAIEPRATPAHM